VVLCRVVAELFLCVFLFPWRFEVFYLCCCFGKKLLRLLNYPLFETRAYLAESNNYELFILFISGIFI
jgi:hypothetical protein